MTQKIIYINSISVAEISQVRKFDRVLGDMAVVSFITDPVELPLVGLAKCVISSSLDNKSRTWTTSLNAKLSEIFDIGRSIYIYIIGTASGEKYIIGSGSKPFPLSDFSSTLPDTTAEPVAFELNVSFIDSFGLTRLLLTV